MKKSVYIETTVFSFYYDMREDSAYRRKVSRDWWRNEKGGYDLYTSFFVLEEVRNPVYPGWQKVSRLAGSIPVLDVVDDIQGIIRVYIENQIMPSNDVGDAAHLALASYHSVDYLLTWNCRHLANANKFDHIRSVNRRLGLMTPELVTPAQLCKED